MKQLRVFKDPAVRAEMLKLYSEGMSSTALGIKYGCNHTSILHQVHLAGIKPPANRVRVRRPYTVRKKPIYSKLKLTGKYDYLLFEKINPGKNYRAYLEKKHKSLPLKAKIKETWN